MAGAVVARIAARGQVNINNICVFATLLFIAILQIGDVFTTNCALQLPGIFESNPVMVLAMRYLGTAWWLPKAWVMTLLLASGVLALRRRPLSNFTVFVALAVATAFFLVILNNLDNCQSSTPLYDQPVRPRSP
jgi:hypothetical protein